MRDRFINLLRETNRAGIENLISYLVDKTDFFTAPASTQYHGSKEGGLLEHSLAVYDLLLKVNKTFDLNIKPETIAVVALLHDVCKTNFYIVGTRNVKDPIIDGKQLTGWHPVPYYAIDDQLPLGHGEKSTILLQQFIRLSLDEVMAIRWHMGAYGASDYATGKALNNAIDKFPVITALQIADLAATYFERK